MPISIRRESVRDIGETVQVTIVDEHSGGEVRATLEVPDEASVLALAITDSGPDGENHAPRNVNIRLRDPAEQDVTMTAQNDSDGRRGLLLANPMKGMWEIHVEYGGGASAEVSASTLKRGWLGKLKAGSIWFSCKTCKLVLRTLVISTLIHMVPLVATGIVVQGLGSVLAALKPTVLDILTQTFTLSAGGVPQFLSICLQYIGKPVDGLMEEVCKWLKLCS
jgi:hypothetical protein